MSPPPEPSEAPSALERYPWLRPLTHVVALGWGTAEVAWLGARPASFGFIALVLSLSEGGRAVAKVQKALRS